MSLSAVVDFRFSTAMIRRMTHGQRVQQITDILLTFNWGNYGLDDLDPAVDPDLDFEWAYDLAVLIDKEIS